MCFSTSASFAASAGLLVVGVAAIYQAGNKQQRVLATIPVIFSVQQFCEGALWLSLSSAAYSHWLNPAMYIFLVFAQVVWPAMVPFTILIFEKQPVRRTILKVLLSIGILISVYLSYCLVHYSVQATIQKGHIMYDIDFPMTNKWYSGLAYLMATIVSPFISSKKHLRLFGIILLASYLATRIFYHDYLISVWCYFAAVLSLLLLFIIRQFNKPGAQT